MRLRTLSRRKQRGTRLAKLLDTQNVEILQAELPHLVIQMNDSTYWVFAILVEDPNLLIQTLWDHGFDATSHSSLQPVPVLNRQLKQRHDSSTVCQGLCRK